MTMYAARLTIPCPPREELVAADHGAILTACSSHGRRRWISTVGGRCRLSLVGFTSGEGDTLQEAANDLVTRLLNLVICVRTSGLSFSTECPPPDPRWLQYLWDLGEIAKQGGDIRDRIFGPPTQALSHSRAAIRRSTRWQASSRRPLVSPHQNHLPR